MVFKLKKISTYVFLLIASLKFSFSIASKNVDKKDFQKIEIQVTKEGEPNNPGSCEDWLIIPNAASYRRNTLPKWTTKSSKHNVISKKVIDSICHYANIIDKKYSKNHIKCKNLTRIERPSFYISINLKGKIILRKTLYTFNDKNLKKLMLIIESITNKIQNIPVFKEWRVNWISDDRCETSSFNWEKKFE